MITDISEECSFSSPRFLLSRAILRLLMLLERMNGLLVNVPKARVQRVIYHQEEAHLLRSFVGFCRQFQDTALSCYYLNPLLLFLTFSDNSKVHRMFSHILWFNLDTSNSCFHCCFSNCSCYCRSNSIIKGARNDIIRS